MTAVALEEAPPNVTASDPTSDPTSDHTSDPTSDPTPVPGAEQRWAEHVRLILEDASLTDAERDWYTDKTIATAPQLAEMFDYWRTEKGGTERVPHGDRIHMFRAVHQDRPMPHPQTWLELDVMGVGRRNIPGWFVGRARLHVALKGSHVSYPEAGMMIPGMLTADPATGLFTVVKAPPRHGRPRTFKPRRVATPRKGTRDET